MLAVDKKYTLEDLYIGMTVKAEQLSEIYNHYMILLYDDANSKAGRLVYCKDTQDKDYDNWFMQPTSCGIGGFFHTESGFALDNFQSPFYDIE